MVCSDCDNLRKELKELKAQTTRYEGKIRDMVSAYKMLETQKQSLEVALSVLAVDIPETGQTVGIEHSQTLSSTPKAETVEGDDNKRQTDQMEALKQAITTLTLVNKRKEMEFKRDRKALMEAKDELQRRCDQFEQQLKEQRQQSKTQNLRRLREQLAEAQNSHERAMTEHGMMLAELQQQYGKEKRRSDNLEKQITEMSQRLATKDELIKRAEIQLKEMTKMEHEMQALRKKAEMTPTVRVMRDELDNVKASSEQEVLLLRTRYAMQSAQLREREARIEQLERRVHELSERTVQAEERRMELDKIIVKIENDLQVEQIKYKELMNKKLETDNSDLLNKEKSKKENNFNIEEKTDADSLLEKFRCVYQQLRALQPDFDVIGALCLDVSSIVTVQRPLSSCSDITGPSISTPCSTPVPISGTLLGADTTSRNASYANLSLATTSAHEVNTSTGLCNSCAASHRELDFFKNLIGHLQKKLSTLEENHERTKKEHKNTIDTLNERIFELESSQQRQYAQLAAEAKQRVAELEQELQKQRNHLLEIVAEKDREIELTKNGLAAFYARNYGGAQIDGIPTLENQNLPMDPPQLPTTNDSRTPPLPAENNFIPPIIKPDNHGKKPTIVCRRKDSIGSIVSTTDHRRSSVDEQSLMISGCLYRASDNQRTTDFNASYSSTTNRRLVNRGNTLQYGNANFGAETSGFTGGAAARNIFYEQELCKREREISELRNVIRLLEMKMRDIEQAMLLKDVQYLQIIETLKEEIRVLEGRLTLASSQTNLAYLRNIFVQFLNQGSAIGRKHILKAIGAVLQLTHAEMQHVERWSH